MSSLDCQHAEHAALIIKDQPLRLSRTELGLKLDELKEKIIELRLQHKEPDDLWYDLTERLENILEQCSAEDLAWFHNRTDELILHLFDRSGSSRVSE